MAGVQRVRPDRSAPRYGQLPIIAGMRASAHKALQSALEALGRHRTDDKVWDDIVHPDGTKCRVQGVSPATAGRAGHTCDGGGGGEREAARDAALWQTCAAAARAPHPERIDG